MRSAVWGEARKLLFGAYMEKEQIWKLGYYDDAFFGFMGGKRLIEFGSNSSVVIHDHVSILQIQNSSRFGKTDLKDMMLSCTAQQVLLHRGIDLF